MDNNKFAIYSMINNNKILCSTNTIYPNVPVFNCPHIKLAIGNNNTKVLHRIRVCYYIDADYNCKCETIEEIGCGKSYQEALINAVEKAKIREKEVIEKVEMMNFYQNTTFEQRQCFFKLFSSPDLLVLFKSNETLPTERLEERRIEGYLSCKDE